MKTKIAIFGSAVNDHAKQIAEKIKILGEALAKRNIIIITGACTGIPYQVASTAYKNNKTEVWGFSPYKTFKDHCNNEIEDDHSIYSKLIYVPSDYEFIKTVEITRKYRNVTTTASCDAGIIVSGRFGTLNEFTNLHDMGKVVGVLTGTGGTADLLPELMEKISKPTKAVIIFSDSPEELVNKVLEEVKKRN